MSLNVNVNVLATIRAMHDAHKRQPDVAKATTTNLKFGHDGEGKAQFSAKLAGALADGTPAAFEGLIVAQAGPIIVSSKLGAGEAVATEKVPYSPLALAAVVNVSTGHSLPVAPPADDSARPEVREALEGNGKRRAK